MDFDGWYELIAQILFVPVAVFLFIMLRKRLGLGLFTFQKRSIKWCVEGVVMEHNTLLPILKDVLVNIVGIAYIWVTLFCAIAGSIKMWIDFGMITYITLGSTIQDFCFWLFLSPIIIRLVFEIAIFIAPMIVNMFICLGLFLRSRIRYYLIENDKYIEEKKNE